VAGPKRQQETLDPSEDETDAPVRPPALREQFATFLKWIKPYREIAALLIASVATIFTGIAWVAAHFATQAALSNLECRINYDKKFKSLAEGAAAVAAAADLRNSQIRVLSAQSSSPNTTALIIALSSETTAMMKANAEITAAAAPDLNKSFGECQSKSVNK
jgi:hypothetical protein